MDKIRVELAERAYTIYVGEGLIERAGELLPPDRRERAAIITDANVAPLYAGAVSGCLRGAGLEVSQAEIEPGERSKNFKKARELLGFLVDRGLTRADIVVALGGGVVGDLAGFVASVYKRGIGLLQVPTTLMSQVDSAIGGKTGVNLTVGKNLVGTFYQPLAVVSDVEALSTVPDREFSSGLAEIAKYSFLDPGRWREPMEHTASALKERDTAALTAAVARCSTMKSEIVSLDEYDTGIRAVLNYGHTMGHALEAASGYGEVYTHGEAVSVGMVYAALVGERTGTSPAGLAARHRALLSSLGLPVSPGAPAPGFDDLLDAMGHDKKNLGDLTMVLLEGEGHPVVMRGLDEGDLRRCYEDIVEGV